MICQQHSVAEDAPVTMDVVLPAAGLSSFCCSAAVAAVAATLEAEWAATVAASSGSC